MSFHEIKKDAKIVDEILLYLLKNDHDEVSINIKREQDEVFITFKCTKVWTSILIKKENLKWKNMDGNLWENLMGNQI